MATKQQSGNNPLDIPRIDAKKGGINAAIAKISEEIAKRTPKESLTAGILQTHNGRFGVPATSRRPQNTPHAWWAFIFTDKDDGSAKAKFTEGFVVDSADGAITEPFTSEEDLTRTIELDEVYYVKITYDSTGAVTAAVFDTYDSPENTTTERYVKIVEFAEGDVPGTFTPKYFRFDSIEWSFTGASTHPWKATAGGSNSVNIAAGELLTVRNDNTIGISDHPEWVRLQSASSYAGGSVIVTAATGYIYGAASKTTGDVMFIRDDTTGLSIERTIPAGTINVLFSETLPENQELIDQFIFIIAEVTLAAEVAGVSKQIITHNPSMWHIDLPPEIP